MRNINYWLKRSSGVPARYSRRGRPAFWIIALCVAGVVSGCGKSVEERTAPRPSLLGIAAGHVAIAEDSRETSMLWGRIGGSAAERESAALLAEQLRPWLDSVELESFEFSAHRPKRWHVATSNGRVYESAMPAPFDAKFPEGPVASDVVHVTSDSDWDDVSGRWVYIQAEMSGSAARTNVRSELLYQRAVEADAAGFIFSLPTPPGLWQSVVPVDKPFTKPDTFFPNGVRPIPAFCIDADDGARLEAALEEGAILASTFKYEPDVPREGANVVGWLRGNGTSGTVSLAAHLDSFFTGAHDDASGLAVMVGLAHRLFELPAERRNADFLFAALSGHHDVGAGVRDFVESNPSRINGVGHMILLEHLDAQPGVDGVTADWALPLNDARAAYVGLDGWPEVEAVLEELVIDTGLMTRAPRVVKNCIADLFVVCDQLQPFTLIQSAPYYHTNHDTMDKLSEQGLQNAVDFHMRLLEIAGAIAPN